jgi:hypothetical protein
VLSRQAPTGMNQAALAERSSTIRVPQIVAWT